LKEKKNHFLNIQNSNQILQQQAAQKVLAQFQEHTEAWIRVDTILETSKNPNTKVFLLFLLFSSLPA